MCVLTVLMDRYSCSATSRVESGDASSRSTRISASLGRSPSGDRALDPDAEAALRDLEAGGQSSRVRAGIEDAARLARCGSSLAGRTDRPVRRREDGQDMGPVERARHAPQGEGTFEAWERFARLALRRQRVA